MTSKPLVVFLASLLVLGALGTAASVPIASADATTVLADDRNAADSTASSSAPSTPATATTPPNTPRTAATARGESPATESGSERTTDGSNGSTGSNASLGVELSGFLLASAASLDGRVESGTWLVAFERASNLSVKQRVLDRRVSVLDEHLSRIERRSAELFGTDNESVLHRARQAELAGELGALRAAIGETKTAATRVGVDATEIKALSAEVSNLTLPPTVVALERRSTRGLTDERNDTG